MCGLHYISMGQHFYRMLAKGFNKWKMVEILSEKMQEESGGGGMM